MKEVIVLPYTSVLNIYSQEEGKTPRRISLKSKENTVVENVLFEARMSSHTALITEAAAILYKQGNVDRIFIPGENTFDSATSELMKKQLVKRGVPEEKITTAENLDNTEDQLKAVKKQAFENPSILSMKFHAERVKKLTKQLKMKAEFKTAEELIIQEHPSVTKEKLEKFAATKEKIFGFSKVYFSEYILRTGTQLGKPGKLIIAALRKILGQSGPTVTDYHFVGTAEEYFSQIIRPLVSIRSKKS